MLSAIAAAGRQGVLFKGGGPVEAAAAVRCVAFDKTGTLTEGATHLTEVVPLVTGVTAEEIIALTASVQRRSEHHLARATVVAAAERGLDAVEAEDFRASSGLGVSGRVDGRHVHAGNRRYFESMSVQGMPAALAEVDRLEQEGKTAVVVAAADGAGALHALGVMAFADRIRSTAPAVIAELRRLGIRHVALITGDNEAVAKRVGAAVGVDSVHAAVLPEQKVELVRALRAEHGGVAMIGDGVNDAPALAAATLGVAMGGAGTDVALEAADLVLMGDDLTRLPYSLALGRAARRTVAISLAFAMGVVVLLAATVLIEGLALPMAVVGHEGSTVLVALNGLRMLGFRQRST
jgi:Cd2+/Zn2+-exporting ATPase